MADYTCTHLPGDYVRYTLPRRQLGALKSFGVVATVFGLLFAAVPVVTVVVVVATAAQQARFDLFSLFPLLFALPFLIVGLVLAACGRFASHGRVEIELRNDSLVMRERAGLLHWTRSLPVAQIRALRVDRPPQTSNAPELAALSVDVGQARPRWIAIGYPIQMLENLAHELGEKMEETGAPVPVVVAPYEDLSRKPESVTDRIEQAASGEQPSDVEPASVAQPVSQPAASRTEVERFEGGGVTLNVPAAGLLKGSRGLFAFAMVWCCITAGVGAGFLYGIIQSEEFVNLLFVVPFLLIFSGIGIGMLIAAINMGTRRVAIAVFDGQLMLMQKNLFGTKKDQWDAEQIQSVRTGPSGMTVNDAPVIELQILSEGGKTGLLAGHADAELYWLADEIRRSLAETRR